MYFFLWCCTSYLIELMEPPVQKRQRLASSSLLTVKSPKGLILLSEFQLESRKEILSYPLHLLIFVPRNNSEPCFQPAIVSFWVFFLIISQQKQTWRYLTPLRSFGITEFLKSLRENWKGLMRLNNHDKFMGSEP